jgi:hypothetical protein
MSGRAIAALGMAALLAMCARTWFTSVSAQERLSGKELPQQSEISGITPKVLVRTDVAGAPGKIEIVTRTPISQARNSDGIITLRRPYFTFLRARWAFRKMEKSR